MFGISIDIRDYVTSNVSGTRVACCTSGIATAFCPQYVKRRKRVLCHDPESSCRVGDVVLIRECQKISKRKSFAVSQIIDMSPAHLAEIELENRRLGELRNEVDSAATANSSS